MSETEIIPKFITFEGGEGSGKSTQSKMLGEKLKQYNVDVVFTREIGGGYLPEKIRDLLMENDFSTSSEMFLIMAARYEHINKVVLPALKQGKWVICDRYIDSSPAYQSIDSDLSVRDIYALHRFITPHRQLIKKYPGSLFTNANYLSGVFPDVTFLLDIDPKEGLRRAKERGVTNKFEEKGLEYHERVREKFLRIAKERSDRIIKIECLDKSMHYIHHEISTRMQMMIHDELEENKAKLEAQKANK